MSKKLIFIVGSSRSGTTLLLSYLCGLKDTKILYETKYLTSEYLGNEGSLIKHIASYFDSFEEEIVIEKTPEHVHCLDIIEQLRKVCKRDVHVIYITRPPVPTVLSILKAKKVLEVVDILGACEKYEESMVSIYNNLILKHQNPNYVKRLGSYIDLADLNNIRTSEIDFPVQYKCHVSYRDLIEGDYSTIYNLLIKELHLDLSDSDVKSLVVNRISNVTKVLPQILKEGHHINVLRDIEEVEVERRSNISKKISNGVSDRYKERYSYIRNYFEHPITKETIYDVVVNKKTISSVDNSLVTIIVPLYNKERYIEETLSSLLNQTYKNIRIVIVDDASTDNSLERVRKYKRSLPNDLRSKVCLYSQKTNLGVSATRNCGIDIACTNSDIISFCDADDIWDTTLIEKSVTTFKKYPYVDCVYSRVLLLKDEKITKDKSKICNGNVFKDAIKYNFLGCGSNLFVKSDILKDYLDIRFDESYSGCEDWDFLIQLSKVAIFKCTKEYLVTYRQIDNSLSSNKKNQFDQGRNILNRYIEDDKQYSRLVTRLFFFYLSNRNFTWNNIKDLDLPFILEIVLDKCKSFVKLYI